MTRRLADSEWDDLRARFAGDCLEFVRERLARDGLVEFTVAELAGVGSCTQEESTALLERLVELEAAERIEMMLIQCRRCGEELSQEEARGDACPHCSEELGEPDSLVVAAVYRRQQEPGRSVPWVLVVHGMNARGAWQEELSWLVATTYGRSVPVFIYKYGIVRPGALLKWRQRSLARDLASRLERLAGERGDSTLGPCPDVLAHSFGTWLLGRALARNPGLSVGRIILMGCILRPDFAWKLLVERGQVEAVLNHYGGRDLWARIAHYLIPDSGPSGAGGFNPAAGTLERRELGFGHSSFFRPHEMRAAYEEVWRPFLQLPLIRVREITAAPGRALWKQAPWPVRATLPRLVLLSAVSALAVALAASVFLGAAQLLGLVSR